jgi:hypothetical protein
MCPVGGIGGGGSVIGLIAAICPVGGIGGGGRVIGLIAAMCPVGGIGGGGSVMGLVRLAWAVINRTAVLVLPKTVLAAAKKTRTIIAARNAFLREFMGEKLLSTTYGSMVTQKR